MSSYYASPTLASPGKSGVPRLPAATPTATATATAANMSRMAPVPPLTPTHACTSSSSSTYQSNHALPTLRLSGSGGVWQERGKAAEHPSLSQSLPVPPSKCDSEDQTPPTHVASPMAPVKPPTPKASQQQLQQSRHGQRRPQQLLQLNSIPMEQEEGKETATSRATTTSTNGHVARASSCVNIADAPSSFLGGSCDNRRGGGGGGKAAAYCLTPQLKHPFPSHTEGPEGDIGKRTSGTESKGAAADPPGGIPRATEPPTRESMKGGAAAANPRQSPSPPQRSQLTSDQRAALHRLCEAVCLRLYYPPPPPPPSGANTRRPPRLQLDGNSTRPQGSPSTEPPPSLTVVRACQVGELLVSETLQSLPQDYARLLEYGCLHERRDAFLTAATTLKRAHGLGRGRVVPACPTPKMSRSASMVVPAASSAIPAAMNGNSSDGNKDHDGGNSHGGEQAAAAGAYASDRQAMAVKRKERLLRRLRALPAEDGVKGKLSRTREGEDRRKVPADGDEKAAAPEIPSSAAVGQDEDEHHDTHTVAGGLVDDAALESFLDGYVGFIDESAPYFLEDYAAHAALTAREEAHVVACFLSEQYIVPVLERICLLYEQLANEVDHNAHGDLPQQQQQQQQLPTSSSAMALSQRISGSNSEATTALQPAVAAAAAVTPSAPAVESDKPEPVLSSIEVVEGSGPVKGGEAAAVAASRKRSQMAPPLQPQALLTTTTTTTTSASSLTIRTSPHQGNGGEPTGAVVPMLAVSATNAKDALSFSALTSSSRSSSANGGRMDLSCYEKNNSGNNTSSQGNTITASHHHHHHHHAATGDSTSVAVIPGEGDPRKSVLTPSSAHIDRHVPHDSPSTATAQSAAATVSAPTVATLPSPHVCFAEPPSYQQHLQHQLAGHAANLRLVLPFSSRVPMPQQSANMSTALLPSVHHSGNSSIYRKDGLPSRDGEGGGEDSNPMNHVGHQPDQQQQQSSLSARAAAAAPTAYALRDPDAVAKYLEAIAEVIFPQIGADEDALPRASPPAPLPPPPEQELTKRNSSNNNTSSGGATAQQQQGESEDVSVPSRFLQPSASVPLQGAEERPVTPHAPLLPPPMTGSSPRLFVASAHSGSSTSTPATSSDVAVLTSSVPLPPYPPQTLNSDCSSEHAEESVSPVQEKGSSVGGGGGGGGGAFPRFLFVGNRSNGSSGSGGGSGGHTNHDDNDNTSKEEAPARESSLMDTSAQKPPLPPKDDKLRQQHRASQGRHVAKSQRRMPSSASEGDLALLFAQAVQSMLMDVIMETVAAPAWHTLLDKVYRAYLVTHVEHQHQQRCRLLLRMRVAETLEKRMTHRLPLSVMFKLPQQPGQPGQLSLSSSAHNEGPEEEEARPMPIDATATADRHAGMPTPPPQPRPTNSGGSSAIAGGAPVRSLGSLLLQGRSNPGDARAAAVATATTTATTVVPSSAAASALPAPAVGVVEVDRKSQRELNSIIDEALAHWVVAANMRLNITRISREEEERGEEVAAASSSTSSSCVLAELLALLSAHGEATTSGISLFPSAQSVHNAQDSGDSDASLGANTEKRLQALFRLLHLDDEEMEEALLLRGEDEKASHHSLASTFCNANTNSNSVGMTSSNNMNHNAAATFAPSSSSGATSSTVRWLDHCGRRAKNNRYNRFSAKMGEARDSLMVSFHNHVNIVFLQLMGEGSIAVIQRLQRSRRERVLQRQRRSMAAAPITASEEVVGTEGRAVGPANTKKREKEKKGGTHGDSAGAPTAADMPPTSAGHAANVSLPSLTPPLANGGRAGCEGTALGPPRHRSSLLSFMALARGSEADGSTIKKEDSYLHCSLSSSSQSPPSPPTSSPPCSPLLENSTTAPAVSSPIPESPSHPPPRMQNDANHSDKSNNKENSPRMEEDLHTQGRTAEGKQDAGTSSLASAATTTTTTTTTTATADTVADSEASSLSTGYFNSLDIDVEEVTRCWGDPDEPAGDAGRARHEGGNNRSHDHAAREERKTTDRARRLHNSQLHRSGGRHNSTAAPHEADGKDRSKSGGGSVSPLSSSSKKLKRKAFKRGGNNNGNADGNSNSNSNSNNSAVGDAFLPSKQCSVM